MKDELSEEDYYVFLQLNSLVDNLLKKISRMIV